MTSPQRSQYLFAVPTHLAKRSISIALLAWVLAQDYQKIKIKVSHFGKYLQIKISLFGHANVISALSPSPRVLYVDEINNLRSFSTLIQDLDEKETGS